MLFESGDLAMAQLGPDWRWPHFSMAELSCHCAGRFCRGEYWHDPAFLDRLEAIRADLGKPLIINSAHRCRQWNACVGGAPLSRHKTLAADIALAGHDRFILRRAAQKAGFSGFGLARSFIHIDCRPVPAIWFYKGSRSLWQK